MSYITMNVDVDMSDIDDDDLVEEMCSRIRSDRSSEDWDNIRAALEKPVGYNSVLRVIKIENLYDQQKYEHLASVFQKYNIHQLLKLLP